MCWSPSAWPIRYVLHLGPSCLVSWKADPVLQQWSLGLWAPFRFNQQQTQVRDRKEGIRRTWNMYALVVLILAGNAQMVTTVLPKISPGNCSLFLPGMTLSSCFIQPCRTAFSLDDVPKLYSHQRHQSFYPDWIRVRQGPDKKGQVHWLGFHLFMDLKTMSPGLYTCLRCWWKQSTEMGFNWPKGTAPVLVSWPRWLRSKQAKWSRSVEIWGRSKVVEGDWFRNKYQLKVYEPDLNDVFKLV